ncbi:MAG: hypothetical protein RLZZ58_414 [Pseudomonadota bacterium]
MTPLLLGLSFVAIGLAGWCLHARLSMNRLTRQIEAERGEAAARQQQLTREVHHRVKNNLQIVASLLSIHSRAADTPPSRRAFSTIQRRVDALTIVHRNMASSSEAQAGLSLRTLLSELAAVFDGEAAAQGRPPIHLTSVAGRVADDNALPIAFVVTEIIDLIVNHNPAAVIALTVVQSGGDGAATLTIAAATLCDSAMAERLTGGREARILAGLSRQLATVIAHDATAGTIALHIPLSAAA